jgi:hypothetical protein
MTNCQVSDQLKAGAADLPFDPTGKPREKWYRLRLSIRTRLLIGKQHISTNHFTRAT